MVILRYLMCLNVNWIKSYYKKMQILPFQGIYNFDFFFENLRLVIAILRHLTTAWIFFTNAGSNAHFEVLNVSKSYLHQKLQHKTQTFLFLFICKIAQMLQNLKKPANRKFCVLHRSFWSNKDLDMLSISKWQLESQLCVTFLSKCQENGHKCSWSTIYIVRFFMNQTFNLTKHDLDIFFLTDVL